MDKEELAGIQDRIAKYRGVIITDFIDVEAMVGSIIAVYFAKDSKNNEFNRKVIDDEYFSFGLKIKILEKLNFDVYKLFFEDFRRINKIRNTFAHHVPTLDEGFICYNKNDKIPYTKKMVELHKEFVEKIKKVDKQLYEIFLKLVEENKKEKEKDEK
jgi:hypothetical protein